jgi:hypothetical protein
MPRPERISLIQQIEAARGSHVITYVTSDRQPFGGRIAQDAVRPMYEHLLELDSADPRRERIDLFLYSLGGDVSIPWRIVTMLREFGKELCVLVPYRAHSAATMIALGADTIVMGRKAELSPIDPTLQKAEAEETGGTPAAISVEDVSSYISFIKERAGITDQSALGQVISLLADHLTPLTLGSVNRQHSHIRLVAKKLLASHAARMEEDRINVIVEALTEKMYSHGHAIGRKEAEELGLRIERPASELEVLLWSLYRQYEQLMALGQQFDLQGAFEGRSDEEQLLKDQWVACIESAARLDGFRQHVRLRRKRNVPPNLQLNLNLNVNLPPDLDINQLPQQAQQVLQQLLEAFRQNVEQLVRQQMLQQLPVVGVEVNVFGGGWRELADDGV